VAIEAEDVTERLGIVKWERPIPAQLQGQMKGNFPSFIRKTDQERVQNIDLSELLDVIFQESTKLDGSSMTIYKWQDVVGVCSRNVDLKLEQEGNTFVTVGRKILESLDIPEGYAIQGELMGPGIQGNKDGLEKHEFYVFDIFNITEQWYEQPQDVQTFCVKNGLTHVPVIGYHTLREAGILSSDDAVKYADGKGMNSKWREGVVFKSLHRGDSFKAISNQYLLKED
jgi:RNA ligase (TIGR02306 family)